MAAPLSVSRQKLLRMWVKNVSLLPVLTKQSFQRNSLLLEKSVLNQCNYFGTNIRALKMRESSRNHAKNSRYLKLWNIEGPLINPLDIINQELKEPVIPQEDIIFRPPEEETMEASHIFQNTNTLPISSHKGIVNLKQLPDSDMPEIAFLGRSNVGKSSLIKSLFFNKSDIRVPVSKKPGSTRVLKYYQVGKLFCLVDMPGYGHNMPEYYVESMEEYVKSRRQISRIFLLIDGDVGMTSTDEIAIDMLEEFAKPFTIIFTKIDKNSPGTVLKNIYGIKKKMHRASTCLPQPFLVSCTCDWGISLLQAYIAYLTSAHHFKLV